MNFDKILVKPGAIVWILTENEAYPNEDSGRVLCVFLHNHTEANYVEEHLLTFLSIKYFRHSST